MSLGAGDIAAALAAAGITEAVATVRVATDGTPSLVFADAATQPQRTAATAALAALDLTPSGQTSILAQQQRAVAKAAFASGLDAENRIIRAAASVLLDYSQAIAPRVNGVLSVLTNAQKTAIAANGYPTTLLPAKSAADFAADIRAKVDADA